ncbi:sulfotransferase family protein [Acidithiobacillus ferrooxidans F221]|uniref:sulfotransferase family 2 domain-containing protein n=1 Tax=Acidithiobacillus ferrooxidans TaxID=920 RepID=UPI001C06BA17|nr:sulfotransferase family 2 domain-containing protein [Acidithiobacillus ferrooxidans]MBU2808843.1 sulfotransferase family protein [Acidithiobacillus ferrooxidans F221]
MTKAYYSGRVVFHHLTKTAGQAVNDWLIRNLGVGTVTPNLKGEHRELIQRYGGNYPVISAHIRFDGTGLDPRYQYVTVLREPVDRFISWLHYIDKDVAITEDTKQPKAGAKLFLTSDGEEANEAFLESAVNPYVKSFSDVVMKANASWQQRMQAALSVLSEYALIGFQENLPQFIDEFAGLLQVKSHAPIRAINVTSVRPHRDAVSAQMLRNINKLTEWDAELYSKTKEMIARTTNLCPNIQVFKLQFSSWDCTTQPSRAYWKGNYLEHYIARDLSSQNGVVAGRALVSSGVMGYLCHGPYLRLEPGRYLAVATGIWITRGGTCKVDVCSEKGASLHAEKELVDSAVGSAEFSVALEFLLDHEKTGVEFRLMVPDRHQVQLNTVTFLDLQKIYALMNVEIDFSSAEGDIAKQNFGKTVILAKTMSSKVGLTVGPTLQTDGRNGFLCYGPYIALKGGRYEVEIMGGIGPRGLAGAYADVVCNSGKTKIHHQPLAITPFNEFADSAVGRPWQFSLEQDVNDLEIRLRVSERSEINLCGIVLRRIEEAEGDQQSKED